jgi:hypothetical protein
VRLFPLAAADDFAGGAHTAWRAAIAVAEDGLWSFPDGWHPGCFDRLAVRPLF